jgi:hypothetical protein
VYLIDTSFSQSVFRAVNKLGSIKIMRNIYCLILAIFLSATLSAQAKIFKLKNNQVFEGETVKVFARKFNSPLNPTVAKLLDGNGEQFGSTLTIKKFKQGFSFTAPEVSRTKTFNLKVYGGNVSGSEAQEFSIIVFNKADSSSSDPSGPDTSLEVNEIITNTVVLNETNLSANSNQDLLWAGKKIANNQGDIVAQRITINDISLEVDNGTLTWNSHDIIHDTGIKQAQVLTNSSTNQTAAVTASGSGDFILKSKNSTTTVINGSDLGGTVSLPPSGQILSVLKAEFSVSVDGGSTGSRNLRNASLPANARVTRCWYEISETFSSASDLSSMAISIPTDDVDGLVAPITIDDPSDPWDQGAHVCIQNGILTNISNKTTDIRNLQLNITGEALNTGAITVFVEYML